jgi:hypothetical protein
MGSPYNLVVALAFAAAILVVLRWILGGTRRRARSTGMPRCVVTPAWADRPTRRRELASTGSWRVDAR